MSAQDEKGFVFLTEIKDTDKLKNEVSRIIYGMVLPVFEFLEHNNLIAGNGHHDAQRLSLLAEYLIAKKTKLDIKSTEEPEKILKVFNDMMI